MSKFYTAILEIRDIYDKALYQIPVEMLRYLEIMNVRMCVFGKKPPYELFNCSMMIKKDLLENRYVFGKEKRTLLENCYMLKTRSYPENFDR